VVTRKVPELVVDALEVVNVEHDDTERPLVPSRTHALALENLEQVALVVDLGEPIHNCHPVNFLVILRFGISSAKKFQDCRANFNPVTVVEQLLANDKLFIQVRAIRRVQINDVPTGPTLLEAGVPTRHGVTVEHHRVVSAAPDAQNGAIEYEPFAKQPRLWRVNHYKTIIANVLLTRWLLNDLRDSGFFVEFAHSLDRCTPMRPSWAL